MTYPAPVLKRVCTSISCVTSAVVAVCQEHVCGVPAPRPGFELMYLPLDKPFALRLASLNTMETSCDILLQ